jgi:hypothetical protein
MTRRSIAGKLAAIERHHPYVDTSELRRDLRAAGLEEHVRQVVDAFPPLTAEQRSRLALLLQGGGGDATT